MTFISRQVQLLEQDLEYIENKRDAKLMNDAHLHSLPSSKGTLPFDENKIANRRKDKHSLLGRLHKSLRLIGAGPQKYHSGEFQLKKFCFWHTKIVFFRDVYRAGCGQTS